MRELFLLFFHVEMLYLLVFFIFQNNAKKCQPTHPCFLLDPPNERVHAVEAGSREATKVVLADVGAVPPPQLDGAHVGGEVGLA